MPGARVKGYRLIISNWQSRRLEMSLSLSASMKLPFLIDSDSGSEIADPTRIGALRESRFVGATEGSLLPAEGGPVLRART